jgi:hypothetical protein
VAAWYFKLGTLSSPFVEKGFLGATLAINQFHGFKRIIPTDGGVLKVT